MLDNRDIACAIVGAAEPANIDEAAAAADMDRLPDAALARLEEVYAVGFGLG